MDPGSSARFADGRPCPLGDPSAARSTEAADFVPPSSESRLHASWSSSLSALQVLSESVSLSRSSHDSPSIATSDGSAAGSSTSSSSSSGQQLGGDMASESKPPTLALTYVFYPERRVRYVVVDETSGRAETRIEYVYEQYQEPGMFVEFRKRQVNAIKRQRYYKSKAQQQQQQSTVPVPLEEDHLLLEESEGGGGGGDGEGDESLLERCGGNGHLRMPPCYFIYQCAYTGLRFYFTNYHCRGRDRFTLELIYYAVPWQDQFVPAGYAPATHCYYVDYPYRFCNNRPRLERVEFRHSYMDHAVAVPRHWHRFAVYCEDQLRRWQLLECEPVPLMMPPTRWSETHVEFDLMQLSVENRVNHPVRLGLLRSEDWVVKAQQQQQQPPAACATLGARAHATKTIVRPAPVSRAFLESLRRSDFAVADDTLALLEEAKRGRVVLHFVDVYFLYDQVRHFLAVAFVPHNLDVHQILLSRALNEHTLCVKRCIVRQGDAYHCLLDIEVGGDDRPPPFQGEGPPPEQAAPAAAQKTPRPRFRHATRVLPAFDYDVRDFDTIYLPLPECFRGQRLSIGVMLNRARSPDRPPSPPPPPPPPSQEPQQDQEQSLQLQQQPPPLESRQPQSAPDQHYAATVEGDWFRRSTGLPYAPVAWDPAAFDHLLSRPEQDRRHHHDDTFSSPLETERAESTLEEQRRRQERSPPPPYPTTTAAAAEDVLYLHPPRSPADARSDERDFWSWSLDRQSAEDRAPSRGEEQEPSSFYVRVERVEEQERVEQEEQAKESENEEPPAKKFCHL